MREQHGLPVATLWGLSFWGRAVPHMPAHTCTPRPLTSGVMDLSVTS